MMLLHSLKFRSKNQKKRNWRQNLMMRRTLMKKRSMKIFSAENMLNSLL